MEFSSDFRCDLAIGKVSEKALADIFNGKKVEVKTDYRALQTGNVFIEYSSRGADSGILTTESDYYCICINGTYTLISTERLRTKYKRLRNTSRDVSGGDSNTSRGVLLPIVDLFTD